MSKAYSRIHTTQLFMMRPAAAASSTHADTSAELAMCYGTATWACLQRAAHRIGLLQAFAPGNQGMCKLRPECGGNSSLLDMLFQWKVLGPVSCSPCMLSVGCE